MSTRVFIKGMLGSAILDQTAVAVADNEFDENLAEISRLMVETMYENKGVGLAAPQVGASIRMFVMDVGHAGEHTKGSEYGGGYGSGYLVLVNPKILKVSDEMAESEEGCLSLPTLNVSVKRPQQVTVEYCDISGKSIVETFHGLVAAIVQHEIDHLNGITILKHASSLKRSMYNKKIQKANRRFKEMLREYTQP